MKLHIDFDSYFVNAERIKNPSLIGVPCVIFAGSNESFFDNHATFSDTNINFMSKIEVQRNDIKHIDYKHFTVIAASYEAKSFGIKVGDKLNQAYEKCPNLKITKSNISYYKQLSLRVKKWLQSQIPVIEQFSIDEFFADLDGFKKDDEAYKFAEYIQKELLNQFKLPASIGIHKSKWSAKLLTDLAKPFGIKMIDDINEVLKGLDISYFPGIGKKIQQYLRSYGINTLDELVANPEILNKYGKNGEKLLARIKGVDNEEVDEKKDTKSHGISKSFKPIKDVLELRRRIKILAKYLCVWISKQDVHPRKLTVEIKYNSKTIHTSLDLNQPFYEKNLIDKALQGFNELINSIKNKDYNVYYLGLSVFNLDKTYVENIFEVEKNEKAVKLNKTISNLRERFGINCISYTNC